MSRSRRVCVEIMRYLVGQGFTQQVHEREVEKAIIVVRGPDKRTVRNWKLALETLGFLERLPSKVSMRKRPIFQMNLAEYPQLLVELLHEKKQKKLL